MKIANHSDSFRYKLNLQLFAEDPGAAAGGGEPPAADPAQPPGAGEPPAADPSGQGTPPPAGDPPKGINVKYLHEERFIPEAEVPTWVQKGMNHDRLQEQLKGLETQAQMLDRVAKYYGYENNEEFQQAFGQAERDKQAREDAKRMGMDEELYRRYLQPVNEKLTSYEKKIQGFEQKETQRQIDSEVAQLKQQHGEEYAKREKEVFDLAIERGYSLEDAYILLTHKDQVAAAKLQAEQEALKKLQENADTSPGALGGAADEKFGYSNLTPAEKKAFRDKVLKGEAQ